MVKSRSATTLFEVIIALLLVGIALTPALSALTYQQKQARWVLERQIAVQLADEEMDYLHRQGWWWIYTQLGSPNWVGLKHWSIEGWNPVGAPNKFNPVLGGTVDQDPTLASTYTTPLNWNAYRTFRNVYRFRRRVEIWGGGGGGQQPFGPFGTGGFGWTDCFTVRVTVMTDDSGSMSPNTRPGSAFQLVSIIGRGN